MACGAESPAVRGACGIYSPPRRHRDSSIADWDSGIFGAAPWAHAAASRSAQRDAGAAARRLVASLDSLSVRS